MNLTKGKYKNIEIGYGLVSIEDKAKEILVYDEKTNKVGTAKIVKDKPLTVDVTLTEDVTLRSEYFTIELMNHSMLSGTLVNLFALKINSNLFGYYPTVLSTDKQFKPKTTKKKTETVSE